MNSEDNKKKSYGKILEAASIIGGAQGINYLISMGKMKLVALLLGPSGIGLVGLYTSTIELVGTLTNLGIDISGVREVAEAHSSDDPERIARTIKTLRRISLIIGIVSWLVTAALAYPLSTWIFGSNEHTWAIATLGMALFFGVMSGGQRALLQGTRRIGDLARLSVLGAIAGTIIAVGLYAWLGSQGIVPVLIATAAVNFGFTWWIAHRIQIIQIDQTWFETFENSRRLVSLGIAFMYGALLSSMVGLAIRALIVRNLGLDLNGIYQAAWGISGMFAAFIINAMSTDFYPRLTAVAHDNEQVNRFVNEQLEIGILLALPGLLGTLVFAPWIMHLFYSAKFLQGADLLPWFVVGVFGSIINFPVGMIMRAKGAVRWIYLGQTEANFQHLALCLVLIPIHGVEGAGFAFMIHAAIHGIVVYLIARHLSGFTWGQRERKLIYNTLIFILIGCSLRYVPNRLLSLGGGCILVMMGCVFSLRGIVSRLDSGHRITIFARKSPLLRFVCGIK